MKINFNETFKGLQLSKSKKATQGFYSEHLDRLYALLAISKTELAKPLAAHLIIKNPKPEALERLQKEVQRWYSLRSNTPQKVFYFAVQETKPRTKLEHIHVMIVFQSLNDNILGIKLLAERLGRLSYTGDCKAQLRAKDSRKEIITEFGEIKLMGSLYYHNLIHEFEDAFLRFSYLCKVFTKDAQQARGLTYSCSRVPRPKQKHS